MAIPPEDEDVALHTALLAKLAARNGLTELSVGMSGDYETAIRFGATHVRVGTAIFGARGPTRRLETACAYGAAAGWLVCRLSQEPSGRSGVGLFSRNAHGRQNAQGTA